MTKPLIQIDDIGTTREMTDEEFAIYEAIVANSPTLPSPE
jgi:hypothetical protein